MRTKCRNFANNSCLKSKSYKTSRTAYLGHLHTFTGRGTKRTVVLKNSKYATNYIQIFPQISYIVTVSKERTKKGKQENS